MNLLERITGNRVNYSANVLGGVKCDIKETLTKAIKEGINFLETRIRHYLEVVTTDAMFLNRTRNVGTIFYDEAESFGLLGPTARASGLVRDVRVEAPYGAYRQFPISAVTETNGDLEARCVVRLNELLVSCFAIRTILDNMPDGPLTVKMPRKIPAGETIARAEAPRGPAAARRHLPLRPVLARWILSRVRHYRNRVVEYQISQGCSIHWPQGSGCFWGDSLRCWYGWYRVKFLSGKREANRFF